MFQAFCYTRRTVGFASPEQPHGAMPGHAAELFLGTEVLGVRVLTLCATLAIATFCFAACSATSRSVDQDRVEGAVEFPTGVESLTLAATDFDESIEAARADATAAEDRLAATRADDPAGLA